MTDIGAKIGIDGEKQFRQELANITQAGKTLSAQMDTLTSSFQSNEKTEEDAISVSKKLNEQIENQKKLVDKLKEAVQRASEKTGENSTETLKWREKLAKAETALNNLKGQADDTETEVDELTEAEKGASKQTGIFGDVLKANLASELIKKGVQMLASAVKDVAKFFAEAVKGAADYADEVGTLAKVTGMSTDSIQEYKYAADLLDVEFGTIQGSLTKLTSKMSAAKDGNAAAAEAFEKLGISVVDSDGNLRDANEVFEEAITALGKIPNETERDAAAMDIFGKSAKELNPLIETGAENLAAFRQEAHDVGAVMDKDTLESLGELQDSFDRLKGTWGALKRTLGAKIGIKMLPEIEKMVGAFQRLAETGDLEGFTRDVSKQLGELVKKIPAFVRKIAKKLPKALKELAQSDLWLDLAEGIGDTLGALFENLPALLQAGGELIGSIIQGAVMILPNMIGRLINGFDEELDGMDAVTNEHVEAVRKKIAEIPDAFEDIQNDLDSINAKQREAEHWIEIFDELSQKTDPTAEDAERLQTAVDRLNELFPDLGLVIDEETGKWSLNTEEIRKNIKAMADRAKADAYIKAAGQRYEEIVELERERDSLQSELDDVEARLTEATSRAGALQDQISAVEDLNTKLRDGKITVDDYKKAWHDLGIDTEPQFGTMEVMGETVDMLDTNLVGLNKELFATEQSIQGIEREKQPLKDGIGEVQNAINGLNDEVDYFYTKADSMTNEIVDPIAEAADRVYDEGKKISKQLDDGLAQGLKDNEDSVLTAASRVIKNVISRMRAEAQIKSPSKVTKNLIGKNLALGVVEGWDDVLGGMRNPLSLSKSIDGLSREANVTNNNSTNLGGVAINVYAAQGQDVNAIARAVMATMQNEYNAKKAVFA